LRSDRHHIIAFPTGLFIRISLIFLFIIFLIPAYAQNTKGDQPEKSTREARFGNKSKKAKKSKSDDKRVRSKGKTNASSGARNSRDSERAWSGDITGRKIPARRSMTKQNNNIFPQGGRTVTRPSQGDDTQTSGLRPGNRITPRSATGQTRNVYPQGRTYAKSASQPKGDDSNNRIRTGASAQTKIRSSSERASNVYPQKGPFVVKKSPPSKGDSPKKWTGNIARSNVRSATGKTSNVFPQQGLYVRNSSPNPRKAENPPGIKRKRKAPITASKPYMRSTSINPYAGFWNKKQKGERAYVGDISGKKLRTRNYLSPRQEVIESTATPYRQPKRIGDVSYSGKSTGYASATRGPKAWKGDISGRNVRGRNYSSKGRVEVIQSVVRRPPHGVAGRNQLNKKAGISARARAVSGFPGSYRMYDLRPSMRNQGEIFTGTIKSRRPQVGGGSVSGKLWNNSERPIMGRAPKGNASAMGAYSGTIKAMRPQVGGGSVSGKLWNNDERPILGRAPKGNASVIGTYQGNMKLSKKEPGKEVGGYPGKYTMFDIHPAMSNQGELFTGHIKARKPQVGGGSVSGKLWNNDEKPIMVRTPKGNASAMGTYQGNSKVEKKEPDREVGGFPGQYRIFDLHPTMRNQGEEFTGHIRLKKLNSDYIHNKSSDDDALKVRKPGKAYASVTDYQGNIKMKKFDLFGRNDLHPDAQFVKNNQNNVKGEKSIGTNVKLFWAKMFKKSDTQPDHLKEKIQKPRYDKGEIGLWYD